MNTTTTAHTWTLSPSEAAATAERVAKINKRLTKRGYTGLVELTIGEPYTVTETEDSGADVEIVVVDIALSGRPAQYAGWTFVAAVDTIGEGAGAGFVLRCAPGMEATAEERAILAPYACQHCHTTRNNRVYTYLLRNAESGESIQVGKTCMADFLGVPVVPTMFTTTDSLADEVGGRIGGGAPEFAPEYVVAVAVAMTQGRGYVSAAKAAEQDTASTASFVSAFLYEPKARARFVEDFPALASPDTAAAARMIADVLGAPADSEYISNVQAALRGATVNPRHIGLVASTVVAHHNLTERAEERAERETANAARAAAKDAITYAGEVGDKITLTGRIARHQWVSTQYGTSALVIVETGEHVAKMFTSARWADDVTEGDTVTLTGTVKTHQEYEGTRQTVMTRARVTNAPAVL